MPAETGGSPGDKNNLARSSCPGGDDTYADLSPRTAFGGQRPAVLLDISLSQKCHTQHSSMLSWPHLHSKLDTSTPKARIGRLSHHNIPGGGLKILRSGSLVTQATRLCTTP